MGWRLAMLLVLAMLLLGARRLVLGESSGIWDADSQYAPYQMLVGDHARAGRFLLWNPWTSGGSPDGFEPQFGAFSPLSTGIGLLTGGAERGFRVLWLSLWALGALGMVRLGRHLGAPPWAACVVALGWLASGIYTGHAQSTSFLHSIAFLPLMLWRLDAAFIERRLAPALQAGALYGLSALGGYPAFTILTAGYAMLWMAGRLATSRPRRPIASVAAALAVFLAAGVVVMAPTYFGFLVEGRGFTDRSVPLDRSIVTGSNVLEPGALSTLASPYLLIVKGVNRDRLWPRTDLSSCSLYLGGLVTVLGLLGIAPRRLDPWRLWLLGLGLVFLLLSFGDPVPFRGWLYDLVPPTRYFRHAAVFRVYSMLSLAGLALCGAAELAWRRLVAAALVASGLATAAYVAVLRAVPDVGGETTLAHAHFALAWLGTIALGVVGVRLGSARPRLVVALAIALASADALVALEIDRWTMYLPWERWAQIESARSASLDLTPRGFQREVGLVFDGVLDNKNLCLKIPVLRSYSTLENGFLRQWLDEPVLLRAALGADRIWFARDVAWLPPSQEAFQAVSDRARALGAPPLVLHSREALLHAPRAGQAVSLAAVESLPPVRPLRVSLQRYGTTELDFSIEAPEAGWLWVTDRWARGWKATVNGRSVEVSGGNFVFRAVPVTAGLNAVRFRYEPFGYPWLLISSWATLAVAAASAILGRPAASG
jgi:hypothetical protein